ncbi:RlpA family lipoprotein [Pseudomonas sp. BAY1663]|nr:RlpA family lipoprotein [Pseudomonas sp. BAY1663]
MPHYGPVKANPYTVLGKTYYPISDGRRYSATGTASWYGTKFHGQPTANGEKYDLYGMSAAHKTLPLPSYVKVTNLDNGKSVTLRVNDRGPFYSDRIIDLSFAAAKKLGYAESGTARVKVEGIDPQAWWAEQGRPVPTVLAQPQLASVQPGSRLAQPIEQYTPPPQQHAAAAVPVEIDAKKKRFVRSLWPVSPGRRLRQSGCGAAAQGQAERGGLCAGLHQLGGAQPADPASGTPGPHRHAG